MTATIAAFTGKNAFLSNFHRHPFTWNGQRWQTAEHAYQAYKTLDSAARERIAASSTPGAAKRAGRALELRADWETVKRQLMQSVLVAKFGVPELRRQLLATGDAELVEGNHRGDTYWGVCRGAGRNELGKILMRIRRRIGDHDPLPACVPDDGVLLDWNREWLAAQCDRALAGTCDRVACHARAGGAPEDLAHPLQEPTCHALEILARLAPAV